MSPIWWPLDELAGNAVDQARKRFDALTQSTSTMLTEPVLLGHARREFDRATQPLMSGIQQLGQNVDQTISSARQRFDEATKDFDPTMGLGDMQRTMRVGFDSSQASNPLGNMQVGNDTPYTPLVDPSRPAFGQAQDVYGRMAEDARSSGLSRVPGIGGAVTGALQGVSNVAGGLAGSAQAIREGNVQSPYMNRSDPLAAGNQPMGIDPNVAMGMAGTAQAALNALPDIARGAATEAQLPEQVFPQIDPATPVLGGLNSPREWGPIAAGFAQAPTALERGGAALLGRVVRPLSSAAGRAIERTPDLAGAPVGAAVGALTGPEDQTWQDRAKRAAVGTVAGPLALRSVRQDIGIARNFPEYLQRIRRLSIIAGEDAGHFLDDDVVGEIGRLRAMTERRLQTHQDLTDRIGRLEEEMSARAETVGGPALERPPSKGMWAGTGRFSEQDFAEIADRSGLSPYTPQWYDAVDPATIADYRANAASRQGPRPLTPRQQMAELRRQHRELTRQQSMIEGALTEDMNRTATLEDRAARAGIALPELEPVADDAVAASTAQVPGEPVRPPRPPVVPDDPGATPRARTAADEALAVRHDTTLSGAEKHQRIAAIYDRHGDLTPDERRFIREQGTARIRPALPEQQADADLASSLPPAMEQRVQEQQPLVPRTPAEPVGPPLSGYGAEQQQPVPGMGVAPQAPISDPRATLSPQAANAPLPTGREQQLAIPTNPAPTSRAEGYIRALGDNPTPEQLASSREELDLFGLSPEEQTWIEQRLGQLEAQQAPLRPPAAPVGPPLSGYGAEQQQPVPGMGVAPQAPVSDPRATISPQAASTSLPPGRAGQVTQPAVLSQQELLAAGNTVPPGGIGPSTQAPLRPGQTAQPTLLGQQQLLAAGQTPPLGSSRWGISPQAAATTTPPGTPQATLPLPADAENLLAGPLVQPGSPQERRAMAAMREYLTTINRFRYVSLLSNTAGAFGDLVTNILRIPAKYATTAIGAGVEGGLQRAGLVRPEQRSVTMSQIGAYNKVLARELNPWAAGGMQGIKEAWDVILHGIQDPVASDAPGSLFRGRLGLLEGAYRVRLAADTLTTGIGERMASYSLGFREAERAGLKKGTNEYLDYAADVTRRIQAHMDQLSIQADKKSIEAGRRIRVEQGGVAQRLQQPTLSGDKANIEDLAKEAFGISRRLAFQQDVGGLGRALQSTRSGGGPIGWMIPFFKTTYTIGTEGVTQNPLLGTIGTVLDVGRGLTGRGVYAQAPAAGTETLAREAGNVLTRSSSSAVLPASQRLAESTLGALVAMTGGALVAHGLMTDNGPADAAVRRRMMDEGWRPLAIKTANGYIPIARLIGPLAFPLAFGASLQKMHQEGKTISTDAARQFAMSQLSQVGLNSGLRDFYNIVNILFSPDPQEQQRTFDQVLANTLGQAMPFSGIARQINQLTDPAIRDPRTVWQRIIAGYPGASGYVPPRTSETGQVLRRGPGEGYVRGELAKGNYLGATGAATRAFLPGQEVQRIRGQRKFIGSQSAEQDAEITAAINAVTKWEGDPRQYVRPTARQRQLYNRFSGNENDVFTEQRQAEAVRRRTRRTQETNASVIGSVGGGGLPPFIPPTGS